MLKVGIGTVFKKKNVFYDYFQVKNSKFQLEMFQKICIFLKYFNYNLYNTISTIIGKSNTRLLIRGNVYGQALGSGI